MNKRIILTSIVALGFACPAMATTTTDTFPSNGRMQANYIYTNAATSTNMDGVYAHDATVYAFATYSRNVYTLTAGKYMPKGATLLETCKAGYYCPGTEGGQSTVFYSADADQGIVQCATAFPNSAAGTTNANACYRNCVKADKQHSTTVTGTVTKGGTNTCAATACENGWHVSSGNCVANTINITWFGTTAEAISANNAGTVTYGGDIRTPQSANTITGKTFKGWVFTATQPTEANQVVIDQN